MTKEPWGWHITIHAYGTGPRPSSAQAIAASRRAAAILKADDFVGVDSKVVQTAPHGQGAS